MNYERLKICLEPRKPFPVTHILVIRKIRILISAALRKHWALLGEKSKQFKQDTRLIFLLPFMLS